MAKKVQVVSKNVEAFKHDEAKRKNIPTAEYEALVQDREKTPIRVAYERRNRDLDPQLVWRGKDAQDESDLVVSAAPLYIQEKVHPKALIDDLLRETRERKHAAGQIMPDLFSDFNGIPKGVDKTEFYQHYQNWSNRMILGDSLQVMASLAEREGLRGKVQCIYIDPPYGIRFNSNFQWSTTSRDVKDGNVAQITREPEQVKAFRDTWRDGVHSYLSYLRDRLEAARDLLTESGSLFVQISDENVHRIRALLDEVFGEQNCSTTAMTVCHEAGHALDCALGGGFYLSGVDPRIRRAFASATAFVTPYAASACDEYFAEAVRAWTGANDNLSLWPRATRERLQSVDPRMAEIVANLFAEIDTKYALEGEQMRLDLSA